MNFTAFLVWILMPILLVILFLSWVTESQSERAKRWRRSGVSKAEIGRRLGLTKHRVNKLLMA